MSLIQYRKRYLSSWRVQGGKVPKLLQYVRINLLCRQARAGWICITNTAKREIARCLLSWDKQWNQSLAVSIISYTRRVPDRSWTCNSPAIPTPTNALLLEKGRKITHRVSKVLSAIFIGWIIRLQEHAFVCVMLLCLMGNTFIETSMTSTQDWCKNDIV